MLDYMRCLAEWQWRACVARGVPLWHGGCLCGTGGACVARGVPVWHGGACVAKTAFLKATTKQKSTCIPFCVCTYYNFMIKSEVCVCMCCVAVSCYVNTLH